MKNRVLWSPRLTVLSIILCGLALLLVFPFTEPASKTKATGQDKLHSVALNAQLPQENQTSSNKSRERSPLRVLKKKQPGAPLSITAVVVDDSPDGLMPTVYFTVTNNSGKRIITYAVKNEAKLSRGTISTAITMITNPDRKHALRSGKGGQMEFSDLHYGEPPESMILSIDFVEFLDGTRWGPDTTKTGERLDGVRAGAQAQRDALMKVLMADGPEGVIRSLDSITAEADQSIPRSQEWLDGFRGGVGSVRGRVRNKGRDFSEIEKELRYVVDLPKERR